MQFIEQLVKLIWIIQGPSDPLVGSKALQKAWARGETSERQE